ncbi:4-hydroxythreonine-4-phosphate dehydrogenase PdxA [Parasedimentitalea huanghaiensis]|uniref:4-hydroxythreonine-4-phosphate dehydrogenase PdxA n=1 Tax=Parasedimentitalea huanghaiensis TaxID=2682100 RepID=A0A6L6WGX5_9RHOB|nr:4-hydroxythreonine-4-phosphate dehydrogenase PdxA [Zongyanglinia huanghaiensis]MVO17093.1 4-hydroxythreonine-4-phosphate dehydrogenase PdxA [Zongyanglinia huanghaiensis]
MTQNKLPMAITMGDPSGIGPEITVKALIESGASDRSIVFGCPRVMERAARMVNADIEIHCLKSIDDARFAPGTIEVLGTSDLDTPPPMGKVSAAGGQAAFRAIKTSIDCALAGDVSGIVTAPIHKEALSVAGIKYPGHTEMLADLGGADKVAMLLGNEEIRTVLVTIHCSLSDAIKGADYDAQMDAIRLAHQGAIALGFENPRVAVAGLNPHAGEGGLFGREEIEIISPAIKAAQAEGINASGPWPGDTVFMQARRGYFDIVVAQYHDQGLIPVKYMGLEKGVNITLGLPFVRTSPDHGTAFDIAGTGRADASSLITALNYADRLVAAKQEGKL